MPTIFFILGTAALQACHLPQIMRLHRLKSANDNSMLFWVLVLFGSLMLLTYCLWQHIWLLVLNYSVTSGLEVLILGQVFYYRYRANQRNYPPGWKEGKEK